MTVEIDDTRLVAAVAAGDRAALRSLYERHAPWLTLRLSRRCGDRDVVDDALQDTFVAVWRHAARYDGRGEVALLSLAASTYVPPVTASSALAAAWIGAVVVGAIAADDRFVVFRAPAQAALAMAALVAVLVIAHRRERFEIVRDF